MSLDFDADDLPRGFDGAGNWDAVELSVRQFTTSRGYFVRRRRIDDGLTDSQRHYRRRSASPEWRRAQQARSSAYAKRPEVHARRMELQRQRRAK